MESQRSFPRAQNTAILLNPRAGKSKSEMSHFLRYMDTHTASLSILNSTRGTLCSINVCLDIKVCEE
jgi:hypothetical protein